MASCEKCWGQAYTLSRINGKSQGENYREILRKKDQSKNPCTIQEQAGQFWDEENSCDRRF